VLAYVSDEPAASIALSRKLIVCLNYYFRPTGIQRYVCVEGMFYVKGRAYKFKQ